jgi:hypothetical protein
MVRSVNALLRATVATAGLAGALLLVPLSGGVSTAAAAAAAGNDSCSYPSSSFTESTVMRWAQVNGQGSSAQIVGFANDEKGLLLGVNGATPLASAPSNGTNSHHASNASGGDPTLKDPSNRPFYPALYISDITNNPNATTGQFDFQNGGQPVNLKAGQPFIDDVFGSWSTAQITNGNYTVTAPPAQNHWTLGTGSDQPVGTTFTAMGDEGYGAEVRWNASELKDGAGNPLVPGHIYRIQILTHDGDQNKAGGDAGEFCVTLGIPGPPPMSTQSSPGSGTVGDTITDTATLTGNPTPTGSVTFKLYSNATCTNLVFSDTKALSGGVATSAGFQANSPGTYYWVDTYSGDANYAAGGPFPGAPGTAACSTDPNEQSVINPLNTGMTTSATRSVPLGHSITDVATVPGAAGKPTPTGTVSFKAYSDSLCTNLVYSDAEPLSGGQATAGGFTPSSAGTYYWVDTYSGDGNYNAAGPFPGAPGTAACSSDPTEQSNVVPPPPMSTSATSSAIGGLITDTATLSGSPTPTGTVTFRLYSDASCANLVYTDTEPLSGGQAIAGGFRAASTGTYYWVDTYSGDSHYPAAGPFPGAPGTAACSSDPTEQSVVSPVKPAITTQVTPTTAVVGDEIKDTATLTGGSHPTGTITWTLYSDSACSNLVDTVTVPVNGDGTYTASPGFTTSSAGLYFWRASYSGDANNRSVSTRCGDPNEETPVNSPGIQVVKLASAPCADLAQGVTQPPEVTPCNGQWSNFTHGIITLSVPHSGSYSIPIDYQIEVTNTGSTPLALSLNDPRCDVGTVAGPTLVSGSLNGSTLSAGGRAVYTCTHTLTQDDPDTTAPGEPFSNTATVTGTPPSGPPVHGTDIVTVHRKPLPPPPQRFCIGKRGAKKGHRIRWPEGKPRPKACKLPPRKPHPKRPKHPHGFTG